MNVSDLSGSRADFRHARDVASEIMREYDRNSDGQIDVDGAGHWFWREEPETTRSYGATGGTTDGVGRTTRTSFTIDVEARGFFDEVRRVGERHATYRDVLDAVRHFAGDDDILSQREYRDLLRTAGSDMRGDDNPQFEIDAALPPLLGRAFLLDEAAFYSTERGW